MTAQEGCDNPIEQCRYAHVPHSAVGAVRHTPADRPGHVHPRSPAAIPQHGGVMVGGVLVEDEVEKSRGTWTSTAHAQQQHAPQQEAAALNLLQQQPECARGRSSVGTWRGMTS
jgi:hypothetical protein